MRSNPLSAIDSAPAALEGRRPLKIGARTIQDVRVRKDDVHRWQDYHWQRALDAIKESLVERTCEAAQAVIDGLQADLVTERNKLQCMRQQLATEMAARIRTEAERDEARRECLRLQSVAERLRAESDAQKAELAPAPPQRDAAMAEQSKLSDIAPSLASFASPTIADTQIAVGEGQLEVVDDIKRALEQVKAIYDLDVNSDRSSAELVDALTTRLRQARDLTVARSSLNQRDVTTLFEQQIDVMLDLTAGTSFGRHLSISAYALHEPLTPTQDRPKSDLHSPKAYR